MFISSTFIHACVTSETYSANYHEQTEKKSGLRIPNTEKKENIDNFNKDYVEIN